MTKCKIGILIKRQSETGESLGIHKESNKGITRMRNLLKFSQL